MRIALLETGRHLRLACDTEHEEASLKILIDECGAAESCTYDAQSNAWVTTEEVYEAVLCLYEQYRAMASLNAAPAPPVPSKPQEVVQSPPVPRSSEDRCTQTDDTAQATLNAPTQTPMVIVPLKTQPGTADHKQEEKVGLQRPSSILQPNTKPNSPTSEDKATSEEPLREVSREQTEHAAANDAQLDVRSTSTYSGYNTYRDLRERFGL